MRRPWFIAVVAFATVIAFGGLAAAVPAVFGQSTDESPESALDAAADSEALVDSLQNLGAFEYQEDPVDEPFHGDGPKDEPADEPTHEEPAEEPPADEPKHEEPAEEPPADEPKDEPIDHPVDEPDTTPPDLIIDTPEEGAHFDHHKIEFGGRTEPGAHVAAGPWEAEVDEEGHWWIVLFLEPGANRATFVAQDEAGNATEASVTVYYDPVDDGGDKPGDDGGDKPGDDGGDDGWPAGEWEAYQVFGACEENPPYDVFHGWTAPHASVSVTSPYGSGSTTAGEKGGWELKVFFPDAPHGETFTVTVSSAGHSKSFSFTSYSGGGEEGGGHEEVGGGEEGGGADHEGEG